MTDAQLQALDERLFRGPWVLIAPDNTSPARVRNLDAARAAVADGPVRAVAGRVRDGVLVADIDPHDGYAVYGDVCAEVLVAWCLDNDLPYMVRESGRPGGRHVVSLARTHRHRTQWRALCSRLGRRYKTPVDDRTGKSLRLLTAPHRAGLPSPVISCTLTSTAFDQTSVATASSSNTAGQRRAARPATTTKRDTSRSGREYGQLCAMVRAGYSAEAAWRAVAIPGSKAAARGLYWWRRYQWLNAVTTVAAENRVDEAEAWRLAQHAWPASSRRLTHKWWLGLWQRAQQEADRNRPRRKQLDSTVTGSHAERRGQDRDTEIAQLRHQLMTAAAAVLPSSGTRRQRQASASTALFHLVPALVTRGGAISVRDLAERTRLDTKTVRAALALCVRIGLLVLARRYAGGTADSDAYRVGPAVVQGPAAVTSPTSCSTPRTPPLGHANLALLRTRHSRERSLWRLRCAALTRLLPGEQLATSTSRAAKLLRSLHHQRHWVLSLDPAHLQQRRSARRRLLSELGRSHRGRWLDWLDWLATRESIVQAVERIYAGTSRAEDPGLLQNAADTVHRGLRDRRWRRSPAAAATDLSLARAL